jgi:hypothetical protein
MPIFKITDISERDNLFSIKDKLIGQTIISARPINNLINSREIMSFACGYFFIIDENIRKIEEVMSEIRWDGLCSFRAIKVEPFNPSKRKFIVSSMGNTDCFFSFCRHFLGKEVLQYTERDNRRYVKFSSESLMLARTSNRSLNNSLTANLDSELGICFRSITIEEI